MKRKIISLILCIVLVFSLVGCSSIASADDSVYVFTAADGEIQTIVESEHPEEESSLTGEDVPVTMSVNYILDGKPVSAQEAAGKSGHLQMEFTFTSDVTQNIKTEEGNKQVTVPVVVASGMVLENEICSNVSISNGKLLNDGARCIVLGCALAGVKETLDLDLETAEIPDGFTVEMDVENFSMGNVYTFASTDLFQDLDLDDIQSLEDLNQAMTDIQDAMEQLVSGSGELYEGLQTLYSKSQELSDGVQQLGSGAASLDSGASLLKQGADSLSSGAALLNSGLETISSNSEALNLGAQQVFDGLLAAANKQLSSLGITLTAENYDQTLDLVIEQLVDKEGQIDAAASTAAALEQAANALLAQQSPSKDDNTADISSDPVEETEEYPQSEASIIVETPLSVESAAAELSPIEESAEANAPQEVQTESVQEPQEAYTAEEISLVDTGVAETESAAPEAEESNFTDESAAETSAEEAGKVQPSSDSSSSADPSSSNTSAGNTSSSDSSTSLPAAGSSLEEQAAAAAQLASLVGELAKQLQSMQSSLAGAKAQVSATKSDVENLKAQLDAYNLFYQGLTSYTAGVDSAYLGAQQLSSGAQDLADGAASLSSGASSLNWGVSTLEGSLPALLEGIDQLQTGAGELSEGLGTFDEEAIERLVDAVDGDLNGFVNNLKNMQAAANAYSRSHASKYIFRMDEIG